MKDYIVKYNDKWVVAEKMEALEYFDNHFLFNGNFYKNPIPIHPNHLTNIHQHEGKEVEYEVIGEHRQCQSDEGEWLRSYTIEEYAIPNLAASEVDVWDEALTLIKEKFVPVAESRRFAENIIILLKQHYTLTKI